MEVLFGTHRGCFDTDTANFELKLKLETSYIAETRVGRRFRRELSDGNEMDVGVLRMRERFLPSS